MRRPANPIPPLRPDEIERFHSKIAYLSGGCSLWQGPTIRQGYGVFAISRDGRQVHLGAHRVAYKLATGEDPAPLLVLHACDTPPCCTPACLSLGTNLDNVQDMVERQRVRNQHLWLDTIEERLATGLKICGSCKVRLPLEAFCVSRKSRDGVGSVCRPCRRLYDSDPGRWTRTNERLAALGFHEAASAGGAR